VASRFSTGHCILESWGHSPSHSTVLALIDALKRVVDVASHVGVALILVDAKDDTAAGFYRHFGFMPLPDTPLRLALPVATAMQALARH
jgi:hypothetical protein